MPRKKKRTVKRRQVNIRLDIPTFMLLKKRAKTRRMTRTDFIGFLIRDADLPTHWQL